MELKNYMELIVEEAVDRELENIKEPWAKNKRCKFDIMALVLNRLPARYIVTDKGRIMTKIKETEVQFQADILRELLKAIATVRKDPRI
ncbi:MAG: late competence development ComFB family protein [Candidatus Omnitrophica bacterium]|nr:late competence development ComFB family protein [Candidatus Omnitrophota bacterium]